MPDPLPAPLVPADCDLQDFAFMPLDVQRLRSSDLAAVEQPMACWCAVMLWCASWHQVPAASLPDDDRVLANLAGFGRDIAGWQVVRAGALRGFVMAQDGRWYHPVVAEKALEAWLEKLAQRISSGEGNAKRWGTTYDRAPAEGAMAASRALLAALNPQSRALTKRRTSGVPTTSHRDPDGSPDDIPTASRSNRKGQGQGQGQGQVNTPPSPSSPRGREPDSAGESGEPGKPEGMESLGGGKADPQTANAGEPSPNAPRSTPNADPSEPATHDRGQNRPGTNPAMLGKRVQSLSAPDLRAAIELGDPLAVVEAFHATPGHDAEWLQATDGMQIGEIVAVLAWRRYRKDPVRLPSGFRAAVTAWRDIGMAMRRDTAAGLLSGLGIEVDVAPSPAPVSP